MSINGTLTKTDDDAYTGWVAGLTFDTEITLIDNPRKTKESHPDYAIMAKSPRGRDIRIGAAWLQTSRAGNDYLSMAIDMNGGSVGDNAMQDTNGEDGEYTIFPWAAE